MLHSTHNNTKTMLAKRTSLMSTIPLSVVWHNYRMVCNAYKRDGGPLDARILFKYSIYSLSSGFEFLKICLCYVACLL